MKYDENLQFLCFIHKLIKPELHNKFNFICITKNVLSEQKFGNCLPAVIRLNQLAQQYNEKMSYNDSVLIVMIFC